MGRLKDTKNYLTDDAKAMLKNANINSEEISGNESKYLQMVYDEYAALANNLDIAIESINSCKVSLRDIAKDKGIARSSITRYQNVKIFKSYLNNMLDKKIYTELNLYKKICREQNKEIEELHKRDVEYMLMKERIEELELVISKYININ